MLVLGIDPGLATTGFGIIKEDDQGEISEVDHGVVRTDAGWPIAKRLANLYTEITKLILLHQPHEAAVEKLFFARNVTSGIAVGEARGVLLLALAQNQVPIYEYTPLEVKQAVTGYGNADKRQMQEMVKVHLALTSIPKPDDAADALAVALCHAHSYRIKRLDRMP